MVFCYEQSSRMQSSQRVRPRLPMMRSQLERERPDREQGLAYLPAKGIDLDRLE